jgi:hypothetical protein
MGLLVCVAFGTFVNEAGLLVTLYRVYFVLLYRVYFVIQKKCSYIIQRVVTLERAVAQLVEALRVRLPIGSLEFFK